jgi:NADPH:quinone reductase-like Zn-dependent oxidoreductase
VFGTGQGTFTEYARAPESKLAPKPANLTFEQAAVVAVSGQTALQGLRDYGRIQPGQKVLITGASGGVGTFAVQLAKAFGGPWPRPGPWSLPEARLAAVGSDRQLRALLLSRFVGQKLTTFISTQNYKDLIVLTELIEAGKITPVIDRTYPLSEAPRAIRYLEQGHACGKIVITV